MQAYSWTTISDPMYLEAYLNHQTCVLKPVAVTIFSLLHSILSTDGFHFLPS